MTPGVHFAAVVCKCLPLCHRIFLGRKLKERSQRQCAAPGSGIFYGVEHSGSVLPRRHTAPARHGYAVHLINPYRCIFKGKAAQVTRAVFRCFPIGKILRGQKAGIRTANQLFGNAVHQVDAHIGCFLRRHQDSLIRSGSRKRCTQGAVSAQTIGQ